jgi:hypothetical protein
MTDHPEHPGDDELLARLRAADPAASLPPVDDDRLLRLLEDAMSHDTMTETRETGPRHRSPLTWLVAAAAVLLIAGVGVFALLDRDPTTPAPPAAAGPTATELTLPATTPGRCMVPNAQALAQAAVAAEAQVVSVAGDQVTLDVSRWYAGEETDQLVVTAAERPALVGTVDFEDGARYLVAGNRDGDVMVCGFSDRWSEDLAALYAEAFGS